MLNYIDKIIVPFVERVREDLGLDKQQAALAIFDHFKGQLTDSITQVLEKHNIQSVLVPACCTDRLQPLDISVNKSAKSFLRSEFHKWYANEIGLQLTTASNEELEPVDLSTAKMKSVGAQWLVRLDEYISESPDIMGLLLVVFLSPFSYLCLSLLICVIIITLHNYTYNYKLIFISI